MSRATAAKTLEAVHKILACDHSDPERCPPLRSPSCQHALAYFESIEPSFEAAWRDTPKSTPTSRFGDEVPREVFDGLEQAKGKLNAP